MYNRDVEGDQTPNFVDSDSSLNICHSEKHLSSEELGKTRRMGFGGTLPRIRG